jgi:glycosyltransferase involved in cell wall biosynthesis
MSPLISVIIPVYNVSKYLKQCLDSIINQTYKNLEIILVNDVSTDFSLKYLKYTNNLHQFIVCVILIII